MDPGRFWRITEGAASPKDLHDALAELPEADLVSFERLHEARMNESYSWDLWGAAYIIQGGCGDDSFDYFRAYLISLGSQSFNAALANPDSLAEVDLDAEGEEWEDWMSPTMAVVFARTGEYNFADSKPSSSVRSGEPSGEEWDEADLPARFPRLAARYG